jgi:hypothetical protein
MKKLNETPSQHCLLGSRFFLAALTAAGMLLNCQVETPQQGSGLVQEGGGGGGYSVVTVYDLDLTEAVAAPWEGLTPGAAVTAAQYTGTVQWQTVAGEPFTGPFAANTAYKALIALAPKPGYTFTGVEADSFTHARAEPDEITNDADSGTVAVTFKPDVRSAVTALALDALVTAPAKYDPPVRTPFNEDQYTGTVQWLTGDDVPIVAVWKTFTEKAVYKALVTLTVKDGYTFAGVEENGFTYTGADTVTNDAGSGVVTITFPVMPDNIIFTVTNNADSGVGTLREGITEAMAAQEAYTIVISLSSPNNVITLNSDLPMITKNITIRGNGTTITPFDANSVHGPLLAMTKAGHISGLHFKDAKRSYDSDYSRSAGNALASSSGNASIVPLLTLESCIFSGNANTLLVGTNGGAIYTASSLIVLGCTFAGNTTKGHTGASGTEGGAICQGNRFLSQPSRFTYLAGNIFSGNIAYAYPVAYFCAPVTSAYNVSDRGSGTDGNTSGWAFAPTDVQRTNVVFDADFTPSSASGLPEITQFPEDFPAFPATYFDGSPRGSNSTPGAMPAN